MPFWNALIYLNIVIQCIFYYSNIFKPFSESFNGINLRITFHYYYDHLFLNFYPETLKAFKFINHSISGLQPFLNQSFDYLILFLAILYDYLYLIKFHLLSTYSNLHHKVLASTIPPILQDWPSKTNYFVHSYLKLTSTNSTIWLTTYFKRSFLLNLGTNWY